MMRRILFAVAVVLLVLLAWAIAACVAGLPWQEVQAIRRWARVSGTAGAG
jgi:hypothetical protein